MRRFALGIFLFFFGMFGVTPLHAAISCQGSVTCCSPYLEKVPEKCGMPGFPACTWQEKCNNYGGACTGSSNTFCAGICSHADDSFVSNNCRLPQVPQPSPTPGATPTSGGGGWGGCGSCNSCGHDGQCVSDPDGGCQWDPGFCGGGGGGPPPCSPNCNVLCGQGDGCGGTCASTDAGVPGTPTIALPAMGQEYKTDNTNRALLTWNAQSKADSYQLEVWKTLTPAGIDLTAVPNAIYSPGTTSVSTAHRAFDTSLATYWTSGETGSAIHGVSYIGQDFGATPSAHRQVQKIIIKQTSSAVHRLTSVHIQYSDDLDTWITTDTLTLPPDASPNTFTLTDSGSHRAWRILANSTLTGTNAWWVADIEMQTSGVTTTSQLFTSTTASYNLVASSREYTFRVRALNSTCSTQYSHWSALRSFYVVSPISGTVFLDSNSTASLNGNLCTGPTTPVNTSGGDQTTQTGARSGGDINTTTARKELAYDNNVATYWGSSQRGVSISGNAWIGQDFGEASESAKHIRKVAIRQYTSALYNVNSILVEYSDDGSTWTTHQTLAITKDANLNTYLLDSSLPHRFWRIRANQNLTSSYYWIVRELEFHELSGGDVGTLTVAGQDWQNFSESGPVDQAGAYTVHLPYSTTGTNTVSLIITNGQFICSCPAGCVYGGLSSPLADVNFYVTDAQHPWFQIRGGAVLAHQTSGTAIKNPIPTLCTEENNCNPYMITRSAGPNTSGYVLTGGGDVDLRFASGIQTNLIDQDEQNRLARVTNRNAQERYEYFFRLYTFSSNPESDFGDTALDAQKPSDAPHNNTDAYFHNGDLVIEDPWTINSGESFVIFVNGQLNIKNTVNVAQGGFLAFIVKNDIVIDSNVGHLDETSTTPLVEGIFVANGSIRLPSRGIANGGDLKFVGAGTFVGWSGIVMERDYDDGITRRLLNNTNPTELFIYRPDLALRTPERMRSPRYQWREVSP